MPETFEVGFGPPMLGLPVLTSTTSGWLRVPREDDMRTKQQDCKAMLQAGATITSRFPEIGCPGAGGDGQGDLREDRVPTSA